MNTDQAYVDGRDAFEIGKSSRDNPHNHMDAPELADSWYMGWLDARDVTTRRIKR